MEHQHRLPEALLKGFVPTPAELVDRMVAKLFRDRSPQATDRLLDPGCGGGAFIEGILRWCSANGVPVPSLTGIELDATRAAEARAAFAGNAKVSIEEGDFLVSRTDRYDFIVGNPPYVAITGLSVAERTRYRSRYQSAMGRFDLYLLFFEQALGMLKPGGRVVFVTPEKYLYVRTAASLRALLATFDVEEIELIDENAFEGLVTYPTVTTVTKRGPGQATLLKPRGEAARSVLLTAHQPSWLAVGGNLGRPSPHSSTLGDACLRISCGVATGADDVFVLDASDLTPELRRFAHPTLAGRALSIGGTPSPRQAILVPYDRRTGKLAAESELGPLLGYLGEPDRRARLLRRTCVPRKPWYAFHETPPFPDLLQPKILCKDIGPQPWFTLDESGEIIPRHSLYYLIPNDQSQLGALRDYLNSAVAQDWLLRHCQRAANGFIRLQSQVLKRLPIPQELADSPRLDVERVGAGG